MSLHIPRAIGTIRAPQPPSAEGGGEEPPAQEHMWSRGPSAVSPSISREGTPLWEVESPVARFVFQGG